MQRLRIDCAYRAVHAKGSPKARFFITFTPNSRERDIRAKGKKSKGNEMPRLYRLVKNREMGTSSRRTSEISWQNDSYRAHLKILKDLVNLSSRIRNVAEGNASS